MEQFLKAVELTGKEFVDAVLYHAKVRGGLMKHAGGAGRAVICALDPA